MEDKEDNKRKTLLAFVREGDEIVIHNPKEINKIELWALYHLVSTWINYQIREELEGWKELDEKFLINEKTKKYVG